MTDPLDPSDDVDFRSAEQWLAERGIERQRIRVTPPPGDDAASPDRATSAQGASHPVAPPPSAREVRQLASQPPPAVPGEGHPVPAPPGPSDGTSVPGPEDPAAGVAAADPTPVAAGKPHADLSDEVSRAVAFIRRSTATTPASSGRLRRKLEERDVPEPAIGLALEDAEGQGLVDDAAFATALADEGRAKGHAATRIRRDLRKREFDEDVIAVALARHNDRDPEAVAFEVARSKAGSLRGVDAEKAFRRLVGHLARRGHSEWVARKVARQVVFNELEDDVISGH